MSRAETGGAESVFNPRVVAGVVVAGILAFVAFLALFAYSDDFRPGHDGRGHALSVSAVGYQGLVRLIDLGGGKARLIRNPVDLDSEDLVVVAVEDRTDRKALATLVKARGDRPTLIVLPKWFVGPDPARKEWVRAVAILPDFAVTETLKDVATVKLERHRVRGKAIGYGRDLLDGFKTPLPSALQGISGDGLKPLLVGPGQTTILAQVGDGPLYILGEPDLLDNKGLKDKATAAASLDLLDALSSAGARSISFDLTLNGFARKPGALKLIFEPPFLALTIALFVAALLAGLHGAFRFGPAAREARAVAFGKSALVENSAGLFRLARREPAVGPAYAELIREAAAHDSGAGSALQGEALDRYLDRLSGDGTPFSSLADDAANAGDRFDLLAAARALFSWKKDLIK